MSEKLRAISEGRRGKAGREEGFEGAGSVGDVTRGI
jgi:hypothetical protein